MLWLPLSLAPNKKKLCGSQRGRTKAASDQTLDARESEGGPEGPRPVWVCECEVCEERQRHLDMPSFSRALWKCLWVFMWYIKPLKNCRGKISAAHTLTLRQKHTLWWPADRQASKPSSLWLAVTLKWFLGPNGIDRQTARRDEIQDRFITDRQREGGFRRHPCSSSLVKWGFTRHRAHATFGALAREQLPACQSLLLFRGCGKTLNKRWSRQSRIL